MHIRYDKLCCSFAESMNCSCDGGAMDPSRLSLTNVNIHSLYS